MMLEREKLPLAKWKLLAAVVEKLEAENE